MNLPYLRRALEQLPTYVLLVHEHLALPPAPLVAQELALLKVELVVPLSHHAAAEVEGENASRLLGERVGTQ